jgi:hypothetical protein
MTFIHSISTKQEQLRSVLIGFRGFERVKKSLTTVAQWLGSGFVKNLWSVFDKTRV